MRTSRIVLVLFLWTAACDRADRPAANARRDTVPVTAAPARTDSISPLPAPVVAASDTGLFVTVRRVAAGRYELAGRTRAADVLQLSAEDGQRVLYGPAEVGVAGGAFTTQMQLEQSARPVVYLYLADPAGTRQWVIPVPRDSATVHWGGPSMADSAPPRN